MEYGRIKTEYLCYLMNRAQVDSYGEYGYLSLCEILQDTEFIPILELDENRCGECRDLRRDFAESDMECFGPEAIDILDGIYGENGTLMEVMVVLAEKMDFETADSEYEAGVGKWFQEMLGNIGMVFYVNDRLEDCSEREQVKELLRTVIFRKYAWDGEGGLFPLHMPKGDQRYCELIIQMNYYIAENYDIC